MSDKQDNNEPRLSKGLKIFIIAGTVFLLVFSVGNYIAHSGNSEYYRTQIEPDSNLADKELVVKQDTIRKDTAAADSANKEEEEQAKKVFNSIRGDVRHKKAKVEEETTDEEQEQSTTDASSSNTAPAESEKPSTTQPSTKSEAAPKVEKIE